MPIVNSVLGFTGKQAMNVAGDSGAKYIDDLFNKIAGQDEYKDYASAKEMSTFMKDVYGLELSNYKDRNVELLIDDIERKDNGERPLYNRPKVDTKNLPGRVTGERIYQGLKGLGTSDYVYTELKNNVNKDTVVGVILGFNEASPGEYIMHYLADDDVHEGIASRIPKALLRKAQEMGLENTSEYKDLAEYYGAKGTPKYNKDSSISSNDTFTLTKHSDDDKELAEGKEATKVDNMLLDLVYLMLQ